MTTALIDAVAVFGFPLSEEFKEINQQDSKLYTVQYFERARFEYHPELPAQYQVELGQLGRQYLAQNPAPKEALAQVKNAEMAWAGLAPTRVRIPRIKVDADVTEGVVRRILYTAVSGAPFPPTLAQTGTFTNLTTLTAYDGLVPYDVNLPYWSDHAIKSRWFYFPPARTITFRATNNWTFPTGSVWIQHFELN